MTTQVKICGLTRAQDVTLADELGASYLGFIFAPSKRRITPEHAATIASHTQAARVAVTVNATARELTDILTLFKPDYVQFHGDEAADDIARFAATHKIGVIKAVPIASDSDMKTAERYAACDFVLYDAKPPKGATVRGGHGVAIDWSIIARAPRPKRFALAGGLTPQTVRAALTATRAPIVDVSSGVERAPGIKDTAKMQAFFAALL